MEAVAPGLYSGQLFCGPMVVVCGRMVVFVPEWLALRGSPRNERLLLALPLQDFHFF